MKIFFAVAALFLSVATPILPTTHCKEIQETNNVTAKTASAQRIEAIISSMTLEEKIDYVSGINLFCTKAVPRVGIPSFKMSDGPLGVKIFGPAVSYPANTCTAATWDKNLAYRLGKELGRDARARGIHFLLGPGVNICRSPLCGRTFEYLGEDPYLVSKIAVAIIKGIQAKGVVATCKHLAGNNQEWNRHFISTDIDKRTIREIYLAAFEAAIKKGKVGAIMTSYNMLNGEYASQNKMLNQSIVKRKFRFQGLLMSDWWSTYDTVKVANGGLDLEMPFNTTLNKKDVLAAIQSGKIVPATIDDKVRRILRCAMRFGFFDHPQQDFQIPLDNPHGKQVSYEIAATGIVLLKNEGLVPLDRTKIKTLAIIGPRAAEIIPQGGGSSKVVPTHVSNLLSAIAECVKSDIKIYSARGIPEFSQCFSSKFSPNQEGSALKEKGLRGEYFDNPNLEGAPALVRTDPKISFAWKEESYRPNGPVNDYSIRWSGFFTPPQEGDFTFFISGANKFRFFLDDKLIFDRWNGEGESLQWKMIHLEEKKAYSIRVECSVGKTSQIFDFGTTYKLGNELQEAKEIASRVDACVLCVGFHETNESEDMDKTFCLPEAQNTLIQEIAAVNKNVVVCVTSGGNVDMSSWVDKVPSIVQAWFPGQEGGRALGEILFGDVNPSGKLPISFERHLEDNPTFKSYYDENNQKKVVYSEGIFMGYRGYDKSGISPLFPFGHGLSYTTFNYADLKVGTTNGHPPVKLSFTLKNSGKKAGAEVVQVYVQDRHSKVARPEKELKGFEKVFLKPNEEKQVEISLDKRAFSYFDDATNHWRLEPGPFTILVNSSASQNKLKGTVDVASK